MKGLHFKRTVSLISSTLIGLIVFAGCYGKYHKPVEPISSAVSLAAPVPTEAKMSMRFNAKGHYFISDQDGKAVKAEKKTLEALLDKANKEQAGWIEVLGSYTLFQIKKDLRIWLCDKEFQCVEGRSEGKGDKFVFSVNYDGEKLFFADADGKKLANKSFYAAAKGKKIADTWPKPLASLIENTDLGRNNEKIKTLNNFIVFKIKGSEKISIYNPITRCCYVTCYDELNKCTCGFDQDGNCPSTCID